MGYDEYNVSRQALSPTLTTLTIPHPVVARRVAICTVQYERPSQTSQELDLEFVLNQMR